MKRRGRPRHWTDTHAIEEQEIVLGAHHWLIRGTLTCTWTHEMNADCDADGHRGREVTYEDDRRFALLGAARVSHDGEWQDAELTGADIPLAVRDAAYAWAEACDPPDPEPYEEDDGPEYDREDDDERHERRHADDGGW